MEPLPANVGRLLAALRLNHMEARVTVVPKAVGAASRRATFLVHRSPGMGRLEGTVGRQAAFEQAIEVDVISVDDLVYTEGCPPPDLMKIDLEGGEGEALRGMGRILREVRPILLIEVHGAAAADDVWDLLASAGYALHDLERRSRLVSARGDLHSKTYVLARAEGRRG